MENMAGVPRTAKNKLRNQSQQRKETLRLDAEYIMKVAYLHSEYKV